mgnify:CR=1 FL=1
MSARLEISRRKRRKPLPLIAGRQFKLVRDLQFEINRIRQTYRPHNRPVQGLDGELLLAYMRYHDAIECAEACHGEMRCIEIRHNLSVPRMPGRPECDQYQIWLIFEDGYAEPFSYMLASNSFGTVDDTCASLRSRLRWIDRAARCLVQDQINEYITVHMDFEGTCEISGVELDRQYAEAHHTGKTFKWLLFEFLTEWCNKTNASPNEIVVIDTDTIGGRKFKDDALCDAWMLYHAQNARLQVLSGVEHRKQHKGIIQPPWGELFA